MVDLVIRPAGGGRVEKPWALQLRYHESLGPTEYRTIAYVSRMTADEIIRAGAAFWLFGEPKYEAPHD
jgi:hypothetical protein